MMMAQTLFEELRSRKILLDPHPYAVNIGCGDGLQYEDPVYPLYQSGFRGVAIDAWNHEDLGKNLGSFDVVLRPGTFLSNENVLSILREAGCPERPAFLKIDIDGLDADILRTILKGGLRPLAIQAEVNTEIPPPYAFSVCASDKFKVGSETGFFGFSLSYGVDLLASFGYRFYALDFESPWTHDGLWVDKAVLAEAALPASDPTAAFMARGPFLYHIETATKDMLVSWRTRSDYDVVRSEIWRTMLDASQVKLGHRDVPFELFIST